MNTKIVPDGWDEKTALVASDNNIQAIVEKINEIIEVINDQKD